MSSRSANTTLTAFLAGALAVTVLTPVQARGVDQPDPPRCTLASVVATWSLERLAHQVLVAPVQETDVRSVAAQVEDGVGGVILFGNTAPADLGDDLRWLDRLARGGIAPLVMTDEEGGLVQRMANLVGSLPSARDMAATLTPAQVRAKARRVGSRMLEAGVTMDLAPVLDLDDGEGPDEENADGTRSFSIDAQVTTDYGLAFARGLRRAGVIPVVKHFPGLGRATTNPDVAAAWTQPWGELQRHGIRPFRAAFRAGLPAVMVTTARIPGLTSAPATLSRKVIRGVLRDQLGFKGLVITDSLTGGAIRDAGFSLPRAVVQSLRAGADLILFNAVSSDVASVTRSLVRAVVSAVHDGRLRAGRLRQAVVHVLRVKEFKPCR